jgi:hypothetical protein
MSPSVSPPFSFPSLAGRHCAKVIFSHDQYPNRTTFHVLYENSPSAQRVEPEFGLPAPVAVDVAGAGVGARAM